MPLPELENKFNSTKEKTSPVEMIEAIIPLVNAYQQVRKYDSAVHCLQGALPIIREKGEADQEAVVLTALGTAFWEKAQLQKALDQFSPALELFKKSDDEMGERAIFTMVGITFWRKCEWQRALEIFTDVWRDSDGLKIDKMGERAIFAMVGITFWRKCEWQRALEIFTDVWLDSDGLKIDNRFASVQGALERGTVTLQNRVRMGRELQDAMKILQPLFSVCVLYRMLGNREQFDTCFDEVVVLAESLNKTDILNAAKDLSRLIN